MQHARDMSESYFTKADGKALVSEWRRSGLSKGEFCRVRGVSKPKLVYWTKQVGVSPSFIEVTVPSRNKRRESDSLGFEESVEVLIGDAFVRFPSQPGVVGEILDILMGGDR